MWCSKIAFNSSQRVSLQRESLYRLGGAGDFRLVGFEALGLLHDQLRLAAVFVVDPAADEDDRIRLDDLGALGLVGLEDEHLDLTFDIVEGPKGLQAANVSKI